MNTELLIINFSKLKEFFDEREDLKISYLSLCDDNFSYQHDYNPNDPNDIFYASEVASSPINSDKYSNYSEHLVLWLESHRNISNTQTIIGSFCFQFPNTHSTQTIRLYNFALNKNQKYFNQRYAEILITLGLKSLIDHKIKKKYSLISNPIFSNIFEQDNPTFNLTTRIDNSDNIFNTTIIDLKFIIDPSRKLYNDAFPYHYPNYDPLEKFFIKDSDQLNENISIYYIDPNLEEHQLQKLH